MAEKFIMDEEGIVVYSTTSNFQLEKPLVSDNYDINVHNRNMDKIDTAINEVKGQVDGLELTSSKVLRPNGKNVEESLSSNETSISSLKTKVDNGQNHKLTNDDGNAIDISNGNANTLTKCGVYVGSNITNCPDDGFWMIESKAQNSNFIIQEATKFTDPKAPKKTRSCINGVWGEWRSL